MIEIKDVWGNDVTIGDVILWRTKKGFRKGKILSIYIRADWKGGIYKSFIMRPLDSPYSSPHPVKVFIKAN